MRHTNLTRKMAAITAAAAFGLVGFVDTAEAQRRFPVGDDFRPPMRDFGLGAERDWAWGYPQYWDNVRQIWIHGHGLMRSPAAAPGVVQYDVWRRDGIDTRQMVGGHVENVRRVHARGLDDRHTLIEIRLHEGPVHVVDLGPSAGVDEIMRLRRGEEVFISGNRVLLDGTPVLMARHVLVEDMPLLVNRLPVRDVEFVEQRHVARFDGQPPLGFVEPDAEIVRPDELERLIANWPNDSRAMADRMIERYGPPDEFTRSMLIWHDIGPWRRTIVHRVPIPHHEPVPHLDTLEQVIGYQVEAHRIGNLAAFSGNVIVNSPRGEVSVLGASEGLNFLALNLMHEILTDRMTVEEARREFADQFRAYRDGERTPDTQGLRFLRPADAGTEPMD